MKVLPFLAVLLYANILQAQEPLPAPWKHQDIGAVQMPGTAGFAAGVFTLQGTLDIWGVADGCQIGWQTVHGDVKVVARVTAIDNPGGVAHAKAGLCIRESLDAGSRQVTMCVTPTDGTQFLYRDTTDAKVARGATDEDAQKNSVPKGQFPCWLKIVRHGNEISGYESADGEKWQLCGKITVDLAADTVVGVTASSHKKDVLTKVTFDHVTVKGE